MQHLLDHQVFRRVLLADTIATIGVLAVVAPVPHETADIKRVTQDARAARRTAADRAVVPNAAVGAGDGLGIQRAGNLARGVAGGVVGEDAPHDGGLLRVDFAQAAVGLAIGTQAADDSVAIGHCASTPPLTDAAFQAAACLGGEVLEIQGTHGALEADMQFGDLTLCKGDDAHPSECGELVERSDVLLVAREAVQRLGQNDVDPAVTEAGEQCLVARAHRCGAGERCVVEGLRNGPAFAFGPGSADAELVLDRGLALRVRGVAGIESDSHRRHDLVGVKREGCCAGACGPG